jgi:hypothetical protein
MFLCVHSEWPEQTMSEPIDAPRERQASSAGRWRATLAPLAAECGLVGAGILTFALVTVAPTPGGQSASFTASSGYFVWRLLIVLLVLASLVGAGVAVPLLVYLRRRYPDANLTSLALVYLPGAAASAGLHWLGWRNKTLAWNLLNVRITIVLIIIGLALAPVIGLIWIVRDRVGDLAHRDVAPPTDRADERIKELLALRRTLTTALGILAGVISLTVVATGQLRLTQIAAGAPAANWPIALVILYGVFFAAVLALLYVPVSLKWRDSAEVLREALYPTPTNGRPDATWSEGRNRLSELLTLDSGLAPTLGAAFSVLSPFLVSLLGYFLPTPSP